MIVRELDLDLDAFEGPFDLLLTLVLKEEVDLADVDGGSSRTRPRNCPSSNPRRPRRSWRAVSPSTGA